jgi:hypothetical protein
MKYWAYINNEILGPYAKDKLFEIPNFNPTTLICPQTPVGEKTEDWKESATYPEISAMLNSPKSATLNKEEPKVEEQEEPGLEKEPQIDKGAAAEPNTKDSSIEKEPHINKVESDEGEKNDDKEESTSLNQLKPQALSASPLMEETPSSMAPANNFEVNKLSSIKDEAKNEEPPKEEPVEEVVSAPQEKETPSVEVSKSTESAFDPISLSQISRKQEDISDKKEEVVAPIQEEVISPIKEESPVIPQTPDISAPTPIETPAKETASISAEAESGISNKLNELAQNSISKSDLASYMEPLNNKLSLIDQNMSSLDNAKLTGEIKEMSAKLKHMEDIIDEIKINMSIERKPIENTIEKKEASARGDVQQGFATMTPAETTKEPEPVKPKESAEDIARALAKTKKDKNEIVDEGVKATDKQKKAPFIKALIKPILTVVLLAAVLVATAIALKQTGIIDLTKMLPLPAALTGGEPKPEPTPAINPLLEKAISQEPEVKDIKPEIIFFTRTYSNKNGSKTIENQIINTATKMKGDTNLIAWQATKVSEGIYAVYATVPVPSKNSKINYIFEIDYTKKTMKPLNTQAKNILDNLFKIIKPKKKPVQKKRAMKSRKSSRSKRTSRKPVKKIIKPIAKKPAVKKAAPIDDEYEYVYEDEEEDSEDDYILPGVPAFGD